MKNISKTLLSLCGVLLTSLCGCSRESDLALSGVYSFGNAFDKTNITDSFCCYHDMNGRTAVLDYESMETSLLCKKPNCRHTGNECIIHRLNGQISVFYENCAYYFVDEPPVFIKNEEGLPDLSLHSALYRYDFGTNTEEKLMQWEGGLVAEPDYGMLLYNGTLYFMDTQLGRQYDENGVLSAYSNNGGNIRLHSVSLTDLNVTDLCDLNDISALEQYYPYAGNSGDVYMKGLYDYKIYFTVGFIESGSEEQPAGHYFYRHYATYYDLTDGKYYGVPEDYGKIDFSGVQFCSEHYAVICKTNTALVYKNGQKQPIEMSYGGFNDYAELSVADDFIFCDGKAFDLNTKEVHEADNLNPDNPDMFSKRVIARYGDDYIVCDDALNFEKIPAEKLLNETEKP